MRSGSYPQYLPQSVWDCLQNRGTLQNTWFLLVSRSDGFPGDDEFSVVITCWSRVLCRPVKVWFRGIFFAGYLFVWCHKGHPNDNLSFLFLLGGGEVRIPRTTHTCWFSVFSSKKRHPDFRRATFEKRPQANRVCRPTLLQRKCLVGFEHGAKGHSRLVSSFGLVFKRLRGCQPEGPFKRAPGSENRHHPSSASDSGSAAAKSLCFGHSLHQLVLHPTCSISSWGCHPFFLRGFGGGGVASSSQVAFAMSKGFLSARPWPEGAASHRGPRQVGR